MATLILVRHGETDWNAAGRLQGHTDRPLNEYGRTQAKRLAEQLAGDGIAAIYASDLVRARETAEILGERLDVEFEGEATEAHRERVLRAVRRIAERHPGQRIVVVTHGGSLRRIQAAASGIALPVVDNCGTWAVAHEDGTFSPID